MKRQLAEIVGGGRRSTSSRLNYRRLVPSSIGQHRYPGAVLLETGRD